MAAGTINLQANDGKVLSLTAPEGMSANTVGTVAIVEDVVSNIGDQTIAGVKTFSSSPIVPTPTTDMQTSTKKYVDDGLSTKVAISDIGSCTYQNRTSLGADGGSTTAGSWNNLNLNTEVFDNIGATLTSNQITLPAGSYSCSAFATFFGFSNAQARLRDITNSQTLTASGVIFNGSINVQYPLVMNGAFTLSNTTTVAFQYLVTTSLADRGQGDNVIDTGREYNVYTSITFNKEK